MGKIENGKFQLTMDINYERLLLLVNRALEAVADVTLY